MNLKAMELLGLMKTKKKVKEDAPGAGGSVGPGGLAGRGTGPAAAGNNIGTGSVNSLGSPPVGVLGVVTANKASVFKMPKRKKKKKKHEEMNHSEKLMDLLDEELSDADMRQELISTYSAVGDDAEARRQDLADYTEKVEHMNSEELKAHYKESLIHPDDEPQEDTSKILADLESLYKGYQDAYSKASSDSAANYIETKMHELQSKINSLKAKKPEEEYFP